MSEPVGFVPTSAGLPAEIDRTALREVLAGERPDIADPTFDRAWAAFEAMRYRINNPMRRQGFPCFRIEGSATIVPDPLPA